MLSELISSVTISIFMKIHSQYFLFLNLYNDICLYRHQSYDLKHKELLEKMFESEEEEILERVYNPDEDDYIIKTRAKTKTETKSETETESNIYSKIRFICKECHEEFRKKL